MAMNAREAQRMLDKSREHPELTTMVVPSPYGLTGDAFLRGLIAEGFLGTLRELHVTGFSDALADRKTPLGWRQMTKYSGFNMVMLGILHETALRWSAFRRGFRPMPRNSSPRGAIPRRARRRGWARRTAFTC